MRAHLMGMLALSMGAPCCLDLGPASPPSAPEPVPDPAPRGCLSPQIPDGVLPEGLSPGDSRAVIESKLGAPSYCEGPRCHYLALGLDLVWAPEQGAPEDATPTCLGQAVRTEPLEVGTLRVDDWSFSRERWELVWDLDATAHVTFIPPGPGKLVLLTRLEDEQANLVKVATMRSEHDAQCNAMTTTAAAVRDAAPHFTRGLFELNTLALPEGKHHLTPVLEVEFQPVGGEPIPVKVEPSPRAPRATTIAIPATQWLRLGVREVEVARDPTQDTPDLVWAISYGLQHLTRGAERTDTYHGSWTGQSPWMRVSLDDELRVEIGDIDIVDSDVLTSFHVPASELIAAPTWSKSEGNTVVTIGVELSASPPAGATCTPAPTN